MDFILSFDKKLVIKHLIVFPNFKYGKEISSLNSKSVYIPALNSKAKLNLLQYVDVRHGTESK